MFGYVLDSNGRRVVVMDPIDSAGGGGDTIIVNDGTTNYEIESTSREFWCRAQANWSQSGYVSVKLLEDGFGGTEVGNAFNAHFRMSLSDISRARDPNVVIGQDVMCTVDADDTVIVIDPNAYDSRIGTVKAYILDPLTGSDAVEESGSGWGPMDGTGNSTGRGGSGIDWRNYYAFNKNYVRSPTPGDIASGDRVAAGSHNHSVTIGNTSLSLSINSHSTHIHRVLSHCGDRYFKVGVVGDPDVVLGYLITSFEHDDSGNVYTGREKENDSSHGGHSDATLSHSGSFSPDPHSHTGSSGNAHSDPAKFQMFWIERLKNSTEVTGV